MVIIKSTYCYRGPYIGFDEYNELEIEQMVGRAGRPQYDTKGIAIIMTENQNVLKFENMLGINGKENKNLVFINSHMKNCINEIFNVEVSNCLVSDLLSGVKWLKCTYFYSQLKTNIKMIDNIKVELLNTNYSFITAYLIKYMINFYLSSLDNNGFNYQDIKNIINISKEFLTDKYINSFFCEKENKINFHEIENLKNKSYTFYHDLLNEENIKNNNNNLSANMDFNIHKLIKLNLTINNILKKEIYNSENLKIIDFYLDVITLKMIFSSDKINLIYITDSSLNVNFNKNIKKDYEKIRISINFINELLLNIYGANSIISINDDNFTSNNRKMEIKNNEKNLITKYDHSKKIFDLDNIKKLFVNLKFEPTKLGIKMSKNFIGYETVKIIKEEIKNIIDNGNGDKSEDDLETDIFNEEKILILLSKCKEIEAFRSKIDERKSLNLINRSVKYKVKSAIDTASKKAFVLIQADLDSINLENWELKKQQQQIVNIFIRAIDVLKEILFNLNMGKLYILSVILKKSMIQKIWYDSPLILRQLPKVGDKLAKLLNKGGLDNFSNLKECNPRKIESIVNKNAPFGSLLIEAVKSISKVQALSLVLKDNKYYYKIEINNSHKIDDFDGYSRYLLLTLSFSKQKIICKKTIKPRKINLNSGNQIFEVLANISKNDFPITIYCISTKFLGLDASVKYTSFTNHGPVKLESKYQHSILEYFPIKNKKNEAKDNIIDDSSQDIVSQYLNLDNSYVKVSKISNRSRRSRSIRSKNSYLDNFENSFVKKSNNSNNQSAIKSILKNKEKLTNIGQDNIEDIFDECFKNESKNLFITEYKPQLNKKNNKNIMRSTTAYKTDNKKNKSNIKNGRSTTGNKNLLLSNISDVNCNLFNHSVNNFNGYELTSSGINKENKRSNLYKSPIDLSIFGDY